MCSLTHANGPTGGNRVSSKHTTTNHYTLFWNKYFVVLNCGQVLGTHKPHHWLYLCAVCDCGRVVKGNITISLSKITNLSLSSLFYIYYAFDSMFSCVNLKKKSFFVLFRYLSMFSRQIVCLSVAEIKTEQRWKNKRKKDNNKTSLIRFFFFISVFVLPILTKLARKVKTTSP